MLNILKSLPLHVVRKGRKRCSNSKKRYYLGLRPWRWRHCYASEPRDLLTQRQRSVS